MKEKPEAAEHKPVRRWGLRRIVYVTAAMACSMLAVALYSDALIAFPRSQVHRFLRNPVALSRKTSLTPVSTNEAYLRSALQFSSSSSSSSSPSSSSSSNMQSQPPSLGSSTIAQGDQPSLASAGCDLTDGKWVKAKRRPLYSGKQCKRWLSGMWACRLMPARTNFEYENFIWQPNGCNLPEFDSSDFLLRMQNQVVAFVGDSIGRQQYQSLMCMLTGGNDKSPVKDVSEDYGLVKPPGAIRAEGTAQIFIKTNTTIIYYWSASLCELQPFNKSDPNTQYKMNLDRPPGFIQTYLKEMDILILNTGHHWNKGKLEANKWVMHVNGKPYKRAVSTGRELTVHKVVAWLHKQKEINKTNAAVYFRSLSPRHFFDGEWNTGGRCDDNFIPATQHSITGPTLDRVAESAISGTSLHLLNITRVSQTRYDAHISKYRSNDSGQDCLHWCLPGVPDVWNELLYAHLITRATKNRDALARTTG